MTDYRPYFWTRPPGGRRTDEDLEQARRERPMKNALKLCASGGVAIGLWLAPDPAQSQLPQGPVPPQFQQSDQMPVWYYCDDPKGYYPYVARCNRNWRQVQVSPGAGASPPTEGAPQATSNSATAAQGSPAIPPSPSRSGTTSVSASSSKFGPCTRIFDWMNITSLDFQTQPFILGVRSADWTEATVEEAIAYARQCQASGAEPDKFKRDRLVEVAQQFAREARKGIADRSHEKGQKNAMREDYTRPYQVNQTVSVSCKSLNEEFIKYHRQLHPRLDDRIFGVAFRDLTTNDLATIIEISKRCSQKSISFAQAGLDYEVTLDVNLMTWRAQQEQAEKQAKEAEARQQAAAANEQDRKRQALAKFDSDSQVAQQKGPEYSSSSGVEWSISKKKDEMSDSVLAEAISYQSNDNGVKAEIKAFCDTDSPTREIGFTALIIDRNGKPTVEFPDKISDGRVRAKIRINDAEPVDGLVTTHKFSNEFLISVLHTGDAGRDLYVRRATVERVALALLIGADSIVINPSQTTWRIMVRIDTSREPILIKVPIYDPAIQEVIRSCSKR